MFFLILALDYFSKMWASISFRTPVRVFSWFDLVYVENRGISFGLLFGILNPYIMAMGALCICAFLFFYAWEKSSDLEKYGYTAIFAGAIGNILDRLIEGAVVDFIYLHIKDYYWPAFNIADSAICCGVFWILFVQWVNKKPSDGQKIDA